MTLLRPQHPDNSWFLMLVQVEVFGPLLQHSLLVTLAVRSGDHKPHVDKDLCTSVIVFLDVLGGSPAWMIKFNHDYLLCSTCQAMVLTAPPAVNP